MGYYSGSIFLDFEGTNCEKQMMEKLLQLMEPGSDEEWTLPLNDYYDFLSSTALIGILEQKEDGRFYLPFGVPDYTLAPKLFAALFPDSRFHYSLSLEYSVSLNDTPYLTAVYEDKKLMMRDAYLYCDRDDERLDEICRKMVETDTKVREKFEKILEENDLEEEHVDWSIILGELVDDPYEIMASLYDYHRVRPSRNHEYESSFFKDGDLQEYLVCEQIKKHDMSVIEYIMQFSFTEEQLQKFMETATESNFTEMNAFLLKKPIQN